MSCHTISSNPQLQVLANWILATKDETMLPYLYCHLQFLTCPWDFQDSVIPILLQGAGISAGS